MLFLLIFSKQQTPSELNHTNDGFLNSILSDDDFLEMAANEGKCKILGIIVILCDTW